jgi:predicted enzyme related to lactoylglutathione lyase
MTVIETYAPGTFCWADLGTPDAAAAKRFYTGLFGWRFEDRPMGPDATYTMFSLQGKSVAALYQQEPQQPGMPPHWLSYISVDSAADVAHRTRELGGTVLMEAFDVLDVGRMALIQDPSGGVVALWEPRRHIGAGVVGEPNTLCWHELATTDVAGAGQFFGELFGWQREVQQLGAVAYTMFTRDEGSAAGGMMQIGPDWGPVPPHWLIYFAVADCEASAERARELGASVKVPPSDIPGIGRFAVLEDPQGAAFAIIRLLDA